MKFSEINNGFSNLSKPFFNPIKGKRLFFGRTFCVCTAVITFECPSHFRCLSFVISGTCRFNGGCANAKSMAEKERFLVFGLKNGLGRLTRATSTHIFFFISNAPVQSFCV